MGVDWIDEALEGTRQHTTQKEVLHCFMVLTERTAGINHPTLFEKIFIVEFQGETRDKGRQWQPEVEVDHHLSNTSRSVELSLIHKTPVGADALDFSTVD
jgi:hypothetical protein